MRIWGFGNLGNLGIWGSEDLGIWGSEKVRIYGINLRILGSLDSRIPTLKDLRTCGSEKARFQGRKRPGNLKTKATKHLRTILSYHN